MAGFLYFRSGDTRPLNRAGVVALGLGYMLDGGGLETRPTSNGGPGGKSGLVFADAKRHADKTLGYYPDQQTWRKLPRVEGRPELWLGYWNDAKPGPVDLQRKRMLPGVPLTLGDDQEWSIPRLTELDDDRQGECLLPAPLDYDDDGNLIAGKPVGENAELWDAVHPVALGMCFEDADTRATAEDIQRAAFALMKRNYAVDMPELIVLGTLQEEIALSLIIVASCRMRWLVDAINSSKKNESRQLADGSNTSAGEAA